MVKKTAFFYFFSILKDFFRTDYLDFFEPDFVVETEEGISKDLNFERVLSIDSVLEDEKEKHGQEFQYGQSVKSLYKDLYETEFKYKHILDPYSAPPPNKYNNIIYVETEKLLSNDQFKNFIACNFGNFPNDEGLRYFRRNYIKFFNPEVKIFQPQNSYYLIDDFDQSPLDIGCKKLKVDCFNNKPSLFLLDVENNEDLIDFWNLRGVCSKIKAVPIQCIKELSPYLKKFVKEHYPAPEMNELKEQLEFFRVAEISDSKISQPVPIFSRSMSNSKEAESLYKTYIQHHYDVDIQSKWETIPDLKKSTDFLKNKHRPILEADSREMDIKIDEKNPEISLSLLSPKAEKSGGCFLWANVITMQDLSNQTATAFPCNYRKNFINLNIIKDKFDNYLEYSLFDEHPNNYPLDKRIGKTFLSATEGLIIFSHYKNSSENWVLADGTTVIKNWLQSNKKIETSHLSDAGSTAQQIIQLLDFDGISDFANRDIIELLDEMSGKTQKNKKEQKEKRLKSLDYKEFRKRTNKITIKQIASQIIQLLGFRRVNKLANKYVIELLDKISKDKSPKKFHLIEFKEKTDKKIDEIVSKNGKEEYDLDYPPEAQEISDSQQIVQSLGFEKMYYLAQENIIEFLKEKSKKQLDKSDYRKFKEIIKQRMPLIPRHQKDLPEMLLKKKVIELGMEIKCDRCNKKSWYSLKRLDYSLVCDFCFKSYKFPMIDPILEENKYSKWSYRVIGPFALLDYAQGGYAVTLSIRFFASIIGRYEARMSPMSPYWHDSPEKSKLDDKVTWSPGQELTFTSEENPIEVDFILWTQRWNQWKAEHSNIIFGEAKSYSPFKEKDVNNLKKLAEIFPGSILVFATMREYNVLYRDEKERIKKLAKWGREYRVPVMILTGTELFSRSSLLTAWHEQIKELEEKGENEQAKKYRKINQLLIGTDDSPYLSPRALAYFTQYLYLDIPLKSKEI